MSDLSAILHRLEITPDFSQLRQSPPEDAAPRLKSILSDCAMVQEQVEKQVFAVRGAAMLLIEERELWTQFIDPEVDRPYASRDRWMKATFPSSWRYCYDALSAVKELREVPLADLLEMPRVNIETLKKTSTHVRKEPRVIEAAKTQSEAQFTQTLTKDFNQHIEVKRIFKATYDAGEYAEVEKFLQWVGQHLPEPTEDLGAALLAFAIDHNIEVAEEE